MASKFFENFPKITYRDHNDNIILIKDFFRKSRIEQEAVNSIVEYSTYEITDGDRPDILASKLYGNPDLHWIFFLVNDIENYYDWHKDFQTFENYMNKKYPGQLAIGTQSTDIISSSTSKFLLGEKVTSVSSEGRVIEVSPIEKRICIEGGNFVANELITGTVSNKTFTPTSVINHRDGVAYYKNENDIRRNTESSGFTAKTFYENEVDLNEEKRKIKIVKPELIDSIVRRFEEVMMS